MTHCQPVSTFDPARTATSPVFPTLPSSLRAYSKCHWQLDGALGGPAAAGAKVLAAYRGLVRLTRRRSEDPRRGLALCTFARTKPTAPRNPILAPSRTAMKVRADVARGLSRAPVFATMATAAARVHSGGMIPRVRNSAGGFRFMVSGSPYASQMSLRPWLSTQNPSDVPASPTSPPTVSRRGLVPLADALEESTRAQRQASRVG